MQTFYSQINILGFHGGLSSEKIGSMNEFILFTTKDFAGYLLLGSYRKSTTHFPIPFNKSLRFSESSLIFFSIGLNQTDGFFNGEECENRF